MDKVIFKMIKQGANIKGIRNRQNAFAKKNPETASFLGNLQPNYGCLSSQSHPQPDPLHLTLTECAKSQNRGFMWYSDWANKEN